MIQLCNFIQYATHRVVCDANLLEQPGMEDYLELMQEELTPNGSAEEHVEQLTDCNNDGSWTVETQKGVWSLVEHSQEWIFTPNQEVK